MTSSLLGIPRRILRVPVQGIAFFALFFLYTWLVIKPVLIFDGYWATTTFPFFRLDWQFVREFLGYPGGPVECVAAFLCQSFSHSWLGALVITAVAVALTLATRVILASMPGRGPALLHFVPAVLLGLLFDRYHNTLPSALALAAATVCVCAYARSPFRSRAGRFTWFLVLSCALYYVAGGAMLIYAALCAALALPALCLASAAVLPFLVGQIAFRLRMTDAYWRLLPFHADADPGAGLLIYALYLSVPLLVLGTVAWGAIRSRKRLLPENPAFPKVAALVSAVRQGRWGGALDAAMLVVPTALLFVSSFSWDRRTVLEVEHYSRRGDWQHLLSAVRALPLRQYSLLINWDVNRALFHTARLPYEMFSYPQHPLGLLPSPRVFPKLKAMPAWMKMGEILWDLGRVNEAEHMAYEAFEFMGEDAHIVARLAEIAAVKKETSTALIILRGLSRDLVWGGWARSYLARLETDPDLLRDSAARDERALMAREDKAGWLEPEEMLAESLAVNRANRMAFEYLMAHYLLNRDLAGIARNIGHLTDFGYKGIPAHYEEALVLYQAVSGDLSNDWPIGEDARRRYLEFSDALGRYGGDMAAASRELARPYGSTYFYYHVFGVTGSGR